MGKRVEKIVGYQVVIDAHLHKVEERVVELLADGWYPQGGLGAVPGGVFFQAMVKKDWTAV